MAYICEKRVGPTLAQDGGAASGNRDIPEMGNVSGAMTLKLAVRSITDAINTGFDLKDFVAGHKQPWRRAKRRLEIMDRGLTVEDVVRLPEDIVSLSFPILGALQDKLEGTSPDVQTLDINGVPSYGTRIDVEKDDEVLAISLVGPVIASQTGDEYAINVIYGASDGTAAAFSMGVDFGGRPRDVTDRTLTQIRDDGARLFITMAGFCDINELTNLLFSTGPDGSLVPNTQPFALPNIAVQIPGRSIDDGFVSRVIDVLTPQTEEKLDETADDLRKRLAPPPDDFTGRSW